MKMVARGIRDGAILLVTLYIFTFVNILAYYRIMFLSCMSCQN